MVKEVPKVRKNLIEYFKQHNLKTTKMDEYSRTSLTYLYITMQNSHVTDKGGYKLCG